jgi:hypothetical protein
MKILRKNNKKDLPLSLKMLERETLLNNELVTAYNT